ncbi:MAG: xylose isomerase [Planctomycetota bacterium]|nr:xylose isomerase [Planctomycetota bacterium]
MAKTNLTLVSSMADGSFAKALDQHVAWGLSVLDLKDCIFGKNVSDLTSHDARRAGALIRERGLSVYCLSTSLFHDDVERGEDLFRRLHFGPLKHVLEIADVLKPRLISLVAASSSKRRDLKDAVAYVRRSQPWLIPLYDEAADRIDTAGSKTTIVNEAGDCLLSTPAELHDFFQALGFRERICLTWDVQNLWQCGTFPSVTVYEALKSVIGYCYLKGGQHGLTSTALRWRTALADASWPVAEITRRIVRDRVSPIICLNRCSGAAKPGYSYKRLTERDIDFARKLMIQV